MANDDIKTGDPKIRAFVDLALVEGEAVIQVSNNQNIQDLETDLTRAAVALLKDWKTASTPYHQAHVLAFAEALVGQSFNDWREING